MSPGTIKIVDGYVNGTLVRLNVAEVECGHYLRQELAHQVQEAIAAARYDGLTVSISSAFRTMEEQQRLYDGWKMGVQGFNPADTPGHSKHQDGTAIDLAFGSGNERELFAAIAEAHGLTRPIAAEKWHFLVTPQKHASIAETDGT